MKKLLGISLIEVLISLLIFSLGSIALVHLLIASEQRAYVQRNALLAFDLMQTWISWLPATNCADLEQLLEQQITWQDQARKLPQGELQLMRSDCQVKLHLQWQDPAMTKQELEHEVRLLPKQATPAAIGS